MFLYAVTNVSRKAFDEFGGSVIAQIEGPRRIGHEVVKTRVLGNLAGEHVLGESIAQGEVLHRSAVK